jgi:hypothetical protein
VGERGVLFACDVLVAGDRRGDIRVIFTSLNSGTLLDRQEGVLIVPRYK